MWVGLWSLKHFWKSWSLCTHVLGTAVSEVRGLFQASHLPEINISQWPEPACLQNKNKQYLYGNVNQTCVSNFLKVTMYYTWGPRGVLIMHFVTCSCTPQAIC